MINRIEAARIDRSRSRKPGGPALRLKRVAWAAGLALLSPGALYAQLAPAALPQGARVTAGSSSIKVDGSTMTITQSTARLVTQWDSFNIGSAGRVQFVQPDQSSVALNRVVGNDPSQIFGRLDANGRVFLVNPNGILFGATASVKVGGLVASSFQINDDDFLADRLVFTRASGSRSVVNRGSLTAQSSNLSLIGAEVLNTGSVQATVESIALASGEQVVLSLSNSPLISIAPSQLAATVSNTGTIRGRQVTLSAASAAQLIGGVVNNSGVIQATSIGPSQTAAGVRLSGGTVTQTGSIENYFFGSNTTIDATGVALIEGRVQAGNFGAVQITANEAHIEGNVDAPAGRIALSADSAYLSGRLSTSTISETINSPSGGTISVAARTLDTAAGSLISANGSIGGNVTLTNAGPAGRILISGQVQANGQIGAGGRVYASAFNLSLLGGSISADGVTDGGRILWGGTGNDPVFAADPQRDFAKADFTLVAPGSTMSTLGGTGKGGQISLWANQSLVVAGGTVKAGTASAPGFIEMTTPGAFRQTEAADVQVGAGGTVVIDPKNLRIVADADADVPIATLQSGLSLSGFPGVLMALGTSNLGAAVAMSGSRLAISETYTRTSLSKDVAFNLQDDRSARGAVYLFDGLATYPGLSKPVLQGKLTAGALLAKGLAATSSASISDGGLASPAIYRNNFGRSLALQGDRLAIGSAAELPMEGSIPVASGVVDLFNITGAGLVLNAVAAPRSATITAAGSLLPPGLCFSDAGCRTSFGSGVALSRDLLAVGAPLSRDFNPRNCVVAGPGCGSLEGVVFVYGGFPSSVRFGLPTTLGRIRAQAADSLFGYSVALDGITGHLAVGAPAEAGGGAVHLFSGVGTGLLLGANSLGLTTSAALPGFPSQPLSASLLQSIRRADLSDRADFAGVGAGVSLSGNELLAISTIGLPAVATSSGSEFFPAPPVFVLRSETYSQEGVALRYAISNRLTSAGLGPDAIIPPATLASGFRATSVALSGNALAVGLPLLTDGPVTWRPDTVSGGNFLDNSAVPPGFSLLDLRLSDVIGQNWLYFGSRTNSSRVSATVIARMLGSGQNVILQASNDLSVDSPIAVKALAPVGFLLSNGPGSFNLLTSGPGSLYLSAGRSLLVNASISTAGGSVSLVANDQSSRGVVGALRDAGSAEIRMAPGTSINAGTGTVDITLDSGAGRTGTAAQSGDIRVGSIEASAISVVNRGPSLGNVVINSGATLRGTGAGDAVRLASLGGNFLNLAGPDAVKTPAGRWLIYSQQPQADEFGGLASGQLPLWNRSYTASGQPAAVPEAGNRFLFTQQPTLSLAYGVDGPQSVVRVYDGQTYQAADLLKGSAGLASSRGLVTETYGGAFTAARLDDPQVVAGLGATALTLGGGPAQVRNVGDYTYAYTASGLDGKPTSPTGYNVVVTQTGASTGTVTLRIDPKTATVATSFSRVYDGSTNIDVAGLRWTSDDIVSGDTLSLGSLGFSFLDRNVGNSKPVLRTGDVRIEDGNAGKNYQVSYLTNSFAITQRDLTVSAQVASREYDGTSNATLVAGGLRADRLVAGDTLDIGSLGARFVDRNAGDAKPVVFSGAPAVGDGNGGLNYRVSLAPATARISQKPASVVLAYSRAYDGTTDITPSALSVSSADLVQGDSLSPGSLSLRFVDKNAGTAKPVVRSGDVRIEDGNGGQNYQVSYSGTELTVTRRDMSVTVQLATRDYNGSLDAAVAPGSLAADKLVAGDNLSLGSLGFRYSDANVGDAKPAIATGTVAINDGNGGQNYRVSFSPVTGRVTPAPLNVNYLSDVACLDPNAPSPFRFSYTGFASGEDASLVSGAPLVTIGGAQVGTGAALASGNDQAVALNLSSLRAQNYRFVSGTGPATLSVKPATVTAQTKTLDAEQRAAEEAAAAEARAAAEQFVADKQNNARFVAADTTVRPTAGNVAFLNFVGARYADRQERFSSALSQLELNPSAADLATCQSGDAPDTLCIPSASAPQFGTAPAAEVRRKVAYLFGNQNYRGDTSRIEPLKSPHADVDTLAALLRDSYGYDVQVIKDATRRDMVLTLKRAVETHARDESVLIYYAGHGVEHPDPSTREMLGYWMPTDAKGTDARTWISNTDISRFMSLLQSKQTMIVSDSCFSGRLNMERRLQKGDATDRRSQLLARRAVTVMSSGNFEVVKDVGKDSLSPFAWHFANALRNAPGGRIAEGADLLATVRRAVHADGVPQTAQYGGLLSAGYEPGADFFFEKR